MSVSSNLTRLVCDAYREAAKNPALVSAFIDTNASSMAAGSVVPLVSRWSQSNLSTNTKVSFTKQTLVNKETREMVHESVGVAETGVEMITFKDNLTVKVK